MNHAAIILFAISLACFIAAYLNRANQVACRNYLKLAVSLMTISVLQTFF